MTTPRMARLLALYLPQFHPIPENDGWWGQGFTEWTNVTRARPQFPGHRQPRLPADLGFCDLRVPEVRAAQAELAQAHGIEGFCYYHYWFHGKRLLERPFEEVLASGQPNFPFCLAWANETWSRRWLGEDRDILQEQTYSEEDDVRHARSLLPAFADPRYVRVHGRPLFLVYRPCNLARPPRTPDIFRRECLRAGLPEPYLVGIDAHCPFQDCRQLGFDSTMNFQPSLGTLPGAFNKYFQSNDRLQVAKLIRNGKMGLLSARLKVYNDGDARRGMAPLRPGHPHYPCIFVGWDNTPRRGRHAFIVVDSRPETFGEALAEVIQSVQHKPPEDRLVFLNAWNEWAEGNYLEPDRDFGLKYLEAVREANCSPVLTPATAVS